MGLELEKDYLAQRRWDAAGRGETAFLDRHPSLRPI